MFMAWSSLLLDDRSAVLLGRGGTIDHTGGEGKVTIRDWRP
jgi:hypothetical protein